MEDINSLLNIILDTKKNYSNAEGLIKCRSNLEKLSKEDNAILILYLYFFPIYTPLETNKEEFWFIKFKSEKNYNEYDFAKDLLNCVIQYLPEKNYKKFETEVKEKIKLFKNKKLIETFYEVVKDHEESIIATISFITKDTTYFRGTFELTVSPDQIQKIKFIKDVRNYLDYKKSLLNLQKALDMIQIYSKELAKEKSDNKQFKDEIIGLKKSINDLERKNNGLEQSFNEIKRINAQIKIENAQIKIENDQIKIENAQIKIENAQIKIENAQIKRNVNDIINENDNFKDKIEKMDLTIKNMKEKSSNDEEMIKTMNERLEQIDLRDTIKMSFRYLYKVLYSKFSNQMKDETKIWKQIEEIKNILSSPQFKRFEFIS